MRKLTDTVTIKNVYIPLIEDFLNYKIDPESFVQKYMATIQDDPSITYTDADFEVLQAIFEDAISYDPEPDPAHGAAEIDEEELRACCRKNLEKLKQIVETDG